MDLSELKRKTCDLVDPRKLDEVRDIIEADFALLRIDSNLAPFDAAAKFASDFNYEISEEQHGEYSIAWACERISAADKVRGIRPRILIAAACNPMDAYIAICCLLLDKSCDIYYSCDEIGRFVPGGEDNEDLKIVLKRVRDISISIWLQPHIERILKNQESLERSLRPLRTIIAEADRFRGLAESQYVQQIQEKLNEVFTQFRTAYEPIQNLSRSMDQTLRAFQAICEPIQQMRTSLSHSLSRLNLEHTVLKEIQLSNAFRKLETDATKYRSLASRSASLVGRA